MTRKTWYKTALFLPIIFPVFIALATLLASLLWPYNATPTHKNIFEIFELIILASTLFGPAYIPFALVILWLGRRKTADAMRRISWFMPLLFYPVCGIYIILSDLTNLKGEGSHFILDKYTTYGSPWTLIAFLAVFAYVVVFGYSYVLLTHGITFLFQKAGWVTD